MNGGTNGKLRPGLVLDGTEGNDLLTGTRGADSIAGERGDDTLLGLAGNDTLFGDGAGGPPPATFGGAPGDNLILAGAGDDVLLGGYGSDTLSGGQGDDLIRGYGQARFPSPSAVYPYLRDDGPDLLLGGSGRDTLLGGGGNDTIRGGSGADRIEGGPGVDLLAGGAGADTFVFARAEARAGFAADGGVGAGRRDVIVDFRPGTDTLDLSGYRNPFPARPAEEPLFLGTAPFVPTTELQVRYDQVGDRTVVQVFGPVGQPPPGVPFPLQPAIEIELLGRVTPTAADFIL